MKIYLLFVSIFLLLASNHLYSMELKGPEDQDSKEDLLGSVWQLISSNAEGVEGERIGEPASSPLADDADDEEASSDDGDSSDEKVCTRLINAKLGGLAQTDEGLKTLRSIDERLAQLIALREEANQQGINALALLGQLSLAAKQSEPTRQKLDALLSYWQEKHEEDVGCCALI